MPWFVLYTKSRNEKLVAEKLKAMNIEVYCPLLKTERKWSDRIKVIEEPLFKSYCFVRLEENERSKVFNIPGIVRYLFWQNKPAVVRDSEIEVIKLMLNHVDHNLISVRLFKTTDRLVISSGLLTDISGFVLKQQGKTVTIAVDSLKMTLTIDLTKTIVTC